MSIEIVKAIKTRWTAKSLGSSITGGIHHSVAPSRAEMPYAIFTEVSNPVFTSTRTKDYSRFHVQFDVYTDNGNPETSADLADLIKTTFANSEQAAADALSPAGGVRVCDAEVIQKVRTMSGGQHVYRSMLEMHITWEEDRSLVPA